MTYRLLYILEQSADGLILVIRGKRVILDYVLARRFGVSTRVLVDAVKRNPESFPPDFAFQLNMDEARALKAEGCQGKHVNYRPYAFTEHGISVLSSILRSERATEANIEIMRSFVRLREILA
jgi:hypothetical protein